MATNIVQQGVEVYSCDGKKLGKVKHFFSAASEASPDEASMEREFDTITSPAEQRETSATIAMDRVNAVTDASGVPLIDERSPITNEPMSPTAEAPRMSPGMGLGASETKYIEVHHGGLLRIGGESLYVPFSAVNVIEDDGSIVLRCTADEAAELYGQKPAPLDGE
jgi:hypothetical protein